jgi:hypothetical protein
MKNHFLSAMIFLFACLATNIGNAQTWTQKNNLAGVPRQAMVSFTIGNYMYIVTGGDNTTMYNTLWQYDPATDSYTQKASFPGTDRTSASSFVVGANAYLGLGTGATFNTKENDFWKYDAVADAWSQVASMPGIARSGATAISIGGKGYVMGGSSVMGPVADVWEYDPANDSWLQKNNLPAIIGPRYGATGFSLGNEGYFGTGCSLNSDNHRDFWRYNPVNDSFAQIDSLPLYAGRSGAVSFVLGGNGFVGSGSIGDCLYYADFFEFNPATGHWTAIASLPVPRACAVAGVVGGKAYVMGGRFSYMNMCGETWEYGSGLTTDVLPPVELLMVSLYPNPFTDAFSVKGAQGANVMIMDMAGRMVQNERITEAEQMIHCETLPAGMYSIEIVNEGKIILAKKMIKQ